MVHSYLNSYLPRREIDIQEKNSRNTKHNKCEPLCEQTDNALVNDVQNCNAHSIYIMQELETL